MTTKQGVLLGCGILTVVLLLCSGLIGVIVYFVFAVTQPAADAADRFLALLAEGKTKEAYAAAATALRAQQSEEDFIDEVEHIGLTQYASASWRNRNIENNEAKLEGSMTTKTGGVIPLKIKLIKENDVWRVLSIKTEEAQVGTGDGAKKQVPSDNKSKRLAKATLLDFDQALKAKDFAPFHDKISKLWQAQITPVGLQKIFQSFVDINADLSGIKDMEPVFTEAPTINEEGVLVLSGFYPTKPNQVVFKLKYVYEHPHWKLVGIQLNLRP